jgi:hypothetical protein
MEATTVPSQPSSPSGVNEELTLNLKKDGHFGAYKVRMYGRLWPDTPEMLQVVGTESEEAVQALAETFPETIYFVTEEAFA